MSYIKFTYDVDENQWFFDAGNIQVGRNELHFCFISNTNKTRFKDLQFSYSVKIADKIVASGSYPPPGVVYQTADSGPLAISSATFDPDKKYYVSVSASNSGTFKEATFEVTGIRPPKPPFDSWSWNGENWVAPVPMPTDGIYDWHESRMAWNKLTELNAAQAVEKLKPDDGNT
jgi:hypothetical protein